MTHAKGSFQLAGWDEDTYADLEGDRKLTQAEVKQNFTGDLKGEGSVRWQMAYRADGTAEWLGMQQIDGTLGGQRGSFVLRSWGTFDGGKASGEWQIVEGSGTGELENLTGTGAMEAPMGDEASYTLDYEL